MVRMGRATALAVALAAVMLAAPAPASAFKYTHRLKMTVEYRYDWSLRPTRPYCGRSGSGFFASKMSTRPVRVRAEQNRTAYRFVIGIPYGPRGLRDLPARRLRGSYEVANNAPFVGDCAAENNANDTERSDCGTKPAPRSATVVAGGVSRRKIKADDNDVSGPLGRCLQPGLTEIDDPLNHIHASMKPPSKRQLRRHSVTVRSRQSTRFNIDEGDVGTGSITRTISLEFTRL
jgi:hypothetical protein